MKTLLEGTAAYRTLSNDAARGRLSHAYMLFFNDAKNLRYALKLFALRLFNLFEESADGKRVMKETHPDCLVYPAEGKKLTADAVSELLGESVMRPVERDKKVFLVNFDDTSALVQNKLLKTLEEPPAGVYFILGVTTVAPVLDTVKSRVKTLTVPPFSSEEILSALIRKGSNPLNKNAAESCGGIFGVAENMVGGGWFEETVRAAKEICTAKTAGDAGIIALKYGDTKRKTELLTEAGLLYHNALGEKIRGEKQGAVARAWLTPTLVYAAESIDKACSDLKFNAFFQGLLYDLMLRIIEENDKWLKLQA